MIWVAWRQQRPHALFSAALLAVTGAALLLSTWWVSSYIQESGLAACVAGHGDCQVLTGAFWRRFNWLEASVRLFGQFLPLLLGVFWGASLLARELEQGTYRLAWTQVGLAHRMEPFQFTVRGTFPVAVALFAFATGTAAGALTRRVVPALVAALVAVLAIGVSVDFVSQRHRPPRPLRITFPVGTPSPRAALNDQIVESAWVDRSGHTVKSQRFIDICPPSGTGLRAGDKSQGRVA